MHFDEFTKLLSALKENGVCLGRRDWLIFNAWAARPDDHRLARSAERRLKIRIARSKLCRSLFSVPPSTPGDLTLGQSAAGAVRVQLGGPQAHILQVAGSGSGKTNNCFFWLLQLARTAQGIWFTDLFKREYRALAPLFARLEKPLDICSGRQICPAPITPPHEKIAPADWGSTKSDVLALSLWLPPASSNFLRFHIHHLQHANGVFEGSGKHPTLFELRDAVRASKGNPILKNAVLNRFDPLLAELGPEALGHRQGISIPKLCNRRVNFELHGLSYFAQNFIIANLLADLFGYRIACPEERNGPVVFVLDEARRVYSQRAEASCTDGPSYISTMTSLVRGADVTLLVNVQTTDDLSRSIMANSSIKVMGRLGDHQDYERFGRSMAMTTEQVEFCKKRLRPGLYAAQVGGDFNEPFMMKVPLVELPERISDEEAWKSGEALRRELMPSEEAPHISTDQIGAPPVENALTPEEERYLEAVRRHPDLPSTQYARIAHMSTRKAERIRKALVEKGRLKEWPVEMRAHGAKSIFLEPLDDHLEDRPTHPGREGNFVHQLGVRLARKRHGTEGYETEVEKPFTLDGTTKYLDILGRLQGSGATLGVEVESEPDRGLENLRKALGVGLDRVIVLGLSRAVRDAIRSLAQKEFDANQLAHVTFSTLSDYWDEGSE